jgi:uncharacterized short protein YbdD (DUF466 family)
MAALKRLARAAWWYVRQVSGDAGYENYLCAMRRGDRAAAGVSPMSRKEYYLDSLRRRYSGVCRCC